MGYCMSLHLNHTGGCILVYNMGLDNLYNRNHILYNDTSKIKDNIKFGETPSFISIGYFGVANYILYHNL